MTVPTAAKEPLKSPSNLDEPGDDCSFLLTPPVTVYLATINLRGSEAVSGTKWTSFLRPLLSDRGRLAKHWAIVIRDTLYELRLARENRSLVVLRTTHWPSVRDRHDAPIPIGTTTLSDAEILAIGKARFSRWPKHGYSLTFSNCQCFCYRFSWYVCDETRYRTGELNSSHLPIRMGLVQSYTLSALVVALGVGWAVWMRKLWWPVGWDTCIGVLYESSLVFILRAIYTGREHLGGWRDSEVVAFRPTHQAGVYDALGLALARDFAYSPPHFRGFVRRVWGGIVE
ncbi:hypothetical protein QBC34DRAFT_392903 [Podospora aff. communis PSN243]|uniref:Uncharacterized protein n=1 Tax=Podospora aff. communis PSN243 TaxID=3040156 RepID=A0AAV9H229_9PEZI|nr:hypothetical protein QBC34DRAFT_392903 [Podospora aff. communis PSN243]